MWLAINIMFAFVQYIELDYILIRAKINKKTSFLKGFSTFEDKNNGEITCLFI